MATPLLLVSIAIAFSPLTPGTPDPTPDPASESTVVGAPPRTWVYFRDKAHATPDAEQAALAQFAAHANPRTVARRAARRTRPGLFDANDLPVAPSYVDAVEALGADVHIESRWLNAVSIVASIEELRGIAALPFVERTEPVRRGRRHPIDVNNVPGGPLATSGSDYGLAQEQLEQIGLVALHEAGFTGDGIIIGILDTGFRTGHVAFQHPDHPLTIIAEHDFVDGDDETDPEDGDPSSQHRHGTLILGTLASYVPGTLLGAAYDASYILCKTEDTTDEYEGEEDNYVAGLEFIDLNGGDVATSSLGYIDWYTQEELDGETAVTTIAVNMATANGIFCLTAAGNGGHDDDPATSHLIAPSDAFDVLAVGAVTSEGSIVGFSSDGPSADGRVKPEILARGADTWTIDPFEDDGYDSASGTSLATPLCAGAVACLAQAQTTWSVTDMRTMLFATADYFETHGTFDPDYVLGYGIIDALTAYTLDCNGNGTPDPEDIATGTSEDVNGNGTPDECECLADLTGDGSVTFADILAVLAAWGPCEGDCPEDIDGDGSVAFGDVLAVLAAWGECEG